MYTEFYGLREKPFALSPDPRFLYLAEPHREALAHLLYGVEQGEGFIAITGEVGTGKTTLCRTLVRRLGPGLEVAFLFNPSLSPRELLEAIHRELGIESRGEGVRELVDDLNRLLLEKRRDGRRVLLIVDEAQGLSRETLEQIRLLSNLETETEKLVQILLLGQPELDVMLESPSLRQLRQRIGVRWRLTPMSAPETRAYVRHRLRIAAGGERDLFTEPALREVHRRSRGVPRLVNLLCDRALLAGYAQGTSRIGVRLVRRAQRELQGAARGRGVARARLGPAVLTGALLLLLGGGALAWRLTGAPWPEFVGWSPSWEMAQEPDRGQAPPAVQAPPVVQAPPAARPLPKLPIAPAPLVTESALEVQPPPIADLSLALARRPPGDTATSALRAILKAWQLEADGLPPGPLSFPRLLGMLNAHGLGVEPLPRTDLATLRALGHPAVLTITAADGVARVVALSAVADDQVELFGVQRTEPVRVAAAELERHWRGEAFVVWRDFERLPAIVSAGDEGPAVAWIQRALGELGFYAGSQATGRFDPETVAAVRAFQLRRVLLPDGIVGPRTKIALYDALGRYAVPRLSGSAGVG